MPAAAGPYGESYAIRVIYLWCDDFETSLKCNFDNSVTGRWRIRRQFECYFLIGPCIQHGWARFGKSCVLLAARLIIRTIRPTVRVFISLLCNRPLSSSSIASVCLAEPTEPTEPIRGRYQSGRRWHVPVAPRRRPLPKRWPSPVW